MNKHLATKGLSRATGTHYYDFLAALQRYKSPEWYLEVGTQTGRSLALSTARSVSVDPEFSIKVDVASNKPELHLIQATSDDFFAGDLLKKLDARFDLAFLDGMHLYEFLLRDFINTEKVMAPGGMIVMHDCFPWEPSMAERNRRKAISRAWTGDVWKVMPILNAYRPDLDITLYDAAPTGLVVVSNLDPESTVLSEAYDQLREDWDERDDMEDRVGGFKITPTNAAPWANTPRTTVKDKALNFVIKSPVRSAAVAENWGDHHYSVGIATALEALGHRSEVRARPDWDADSDDDAIDLVIRGNALHERRPGHRTLTWLISAPLGGEDPGIVDSDHVFVASKQWTRKLGRAIGHDKTSYLPQAFDATRMHLPDVSAARDGIVFVGLARDGGRPIVNYAIDTETNVQIWGSGWTNMPASADVVADRLKNTEVATCYGGARIVLNDHTRPMRRNGFASNRIFDALACGAAVISDQVDGMPDDVAQFVHTVGDADGFQAAITEILNESPARLAQRRSFATEMIETHSFDARARQIVDVARRIGTAQ